MTINQLTINGYNVVTDTAVPTGGRTVATVAGILANNITFNVKDYGAVGDGQSHPLSTVYGSLGAAQAIYPHAVALSDELDWCAWQAAVNKAAATFVGGITYGAAVYGPDGVYLVNRTVAVPQNSTRGIRIYGDGMMSTVIRATAAMTQVLKLGDLTGQTVRMTLDHMGFDAASLATYAVYGPRVDNGYFDHIRCNGSTSAGAGCSIGYGYTNSFVACNWTDNAGDGFQFNVDFGSSFGANNFHGCIALSNSGFGYRLRAPRGVNFSGGDIEQNAKGGILAPYGAKGLAIHGVYFEANGGAGYAWTTPSRTIKAHILLNGSTVDTTIDGAFACAGVVISGCYVSTNSTGGEEAFVWASAVNGLTLQNNSADVASGSAIPILKAAVVPSSFSVGAQLSGVELRNNQGFATADVVLTDLPTASETTFRRWQHSNVAQQNYAEPDFLRWGLTAGNGGSGGTFKRSSATLRGQPVWEIATGIGGVTDTYGFQVDLTNTYPQLASQTVVWGAWVKQTDTTIGAALYANGNFTVNGSSVGNAAWRWSEVAIALPSSGIVTFGFLGWVMGAAESIYITEPTLVVVGTPMETMYRIAHNRTWWGTGAPTVGTWVAGDRVVNRAPSVGQPKSWMCTVSGAPGTWVSEGNL